MFARNAFFRLKSVDKSSEFSRTFEGEVLPFLRGQKGFLGEILLANPGSLERITISLWESRDDAAAYDASAYRQVLKILGKTIDGIPKIHTYDAVTVSLDNRAT